MIEKRATEAQRTVLIVDDDAAFRASVNNALQKAGYNVVEAGDGADALAALQAMGERIQLLIVDLCLPDKINGLDIIVAAAKRKLPAKIVAASCVYDQMYLEMAQEFGADVAIRKPLPSDVAAWSLHTVQSLLDAAPQNPSSQRLVVVAEDDDRIRRFVKSILQHAGYQVLEAADGAAALAIIEKIGGAVDLLVTDYIMPKLNGAGLVQAMRAKFPHVPVVYMSGYTDSPEGERLDDPARQCAFISKPFFPKAFMEVVRKMAPLVEDGSGDVKHPPV